MCDEVITVPVPASPGTPKYFLYTALSFLSGLPAIARMSHSAEMVAQLRALLARNEFDLVQIEFTQMAHYVKYLEGIPAIIDESDIAYIRRRRFANTITSYSKRKLLDWDTQKLRKYEIGFCSKYRGILVRTDCDRKTLLQEIPGAYIEVIPPWVDISFCGQVVPERAENHLLFYGAMWRPVNEQAAVYFLEKIFPKVVAEEPDARFTILGSRPSSRLQNVASHQVQVTGFVSDVLPFYNQTAVVVVPLLSGAGIKGKIVQALACGKPVVTTSVGGEGIPASEADGLFVRDDPQQFADCVLLLLRGKRYLNYFHPARSFFTRYYNWTDGIDRIEALYQKLASQVDSNHELLGTSA